MSVAIGDVVAAADVADVFMAQITGQAAKVAPVHIDHEFGMCPDGTHPMYIGHQVQIDGSEDDELSRVSLIVEDTGQHGEFDGRVVVMYSAMTDVLETENVPVILAGAGLLTLVVEDAVDTAWLEEMEREYNSEELAELEQEFDDELFTELGSLFVGETSADDNEE
jgi:hypothetical protein